MLLDEELLDEELLDEELLDEELLDEEALLPPPKPPSGADTEHAAPESSAAPSVKSETGRFQRARCMDMGLCLDRRGNVSGSITPGSHGQPLRRPAAPIA